MLVDPKRYYRNTRTGQKSVHLYDILDDALILHPACVQQWTDEQPQTLFAGVEVVPYIELIPTWLKRVLWPEVTTNRTKEQFIAEFIPAFSDAVESNWEPERFKIVFATTGYDSRIFYATIKRLVEKNGEDWLGEIVFCCWGFETTVFAKIMDYLDWGDAKHSAVFAVPGWNEPISNIDDRVLDFSQAWRHQNGVGAGPINYWASILMRLESERKIPTNTEVWNNNVLSGLCRSPVSDLFFLGYHLYHGDWASTVPYPIKIPAGSSQVMPLFIGADNYLDVATIRQEILAMLDPELAKFPNTQGGRHNTWKKLSPVQNERVRSDYKASWYGRTVAPEKVDNATDRVEGDDCIGISNWWRHYSTASLCEHLLATGHKINVA